MYEHLIVNEQGRLVEVHLNRPQVRHALSHALMREITAVARALSERTDIDVVILTGDMRCFSAGADLNDAQAWADDSLSTVQRRDIAGTGFRMCKAWEEMPQITIAAIEGYAVGGGLAQDAFVSLPEIALGIPLTWGTIPRLVNLLGPAKAKRLTILCERMAAPEALSLGLVDYVSDKGQALARAQALAAQTLAQPAATMRMSKESVNAAATALNHATSYMAHDQIALAASSPESRAARDQAML